MGESRGKELMMTLTPADGSSSPLYILFSMGMTGFFEARPCLAEVHKHAHLNFVASDEMVLSFVDPWRFGTWQSQKQFEWSPDRGPCPVKEHLAFRCRVVEAVAGKPKRFDRRPICQVLHDQSLFNGIGNYLRAEVLYRAGVPPFASSLEALEKLSSEMPADGDSDLLTLCRDVPSEVIALNLSKYQGGNNSKSEEGDHEHELWQKWLKVYGQEGASWAVDKQGRRIWYFGPPGRLLANFASATSENASSERLVRKRPAAATTRTAPKPRKKNISKKPATTRTGPKPRKKNILKKAHFPDPS